VTKLTVVKDFPAPERTDYARFDRFDRWAKRLSEKRSAYYSTLRKAEVAEESKNLASIKAAIEQLGSLLTWVDEFQEDITKCKAEQRFFEPEEAHDMNWEVTKAEATRQVVALLDSYPTVNITNPKVYARTLVEEILAAETSGIPLEATCREIRRAMKTPPSIAAFLEILAKHKGIWGGRWDVLFEDDDLADYARKEHAGLLALAQSLEQEQERQAEAARLAVANATQVHHAKFGIGRVIHQDGAKLTVVFETVGEKVLLDSFVTPIEPADDSW
jgi:hypothetical protein